jgi:predicted HTH domain antitoxin
MTVVQRVSRTELARNTRRVLSDVQRGRTTLIETHGIPEAALLDIVDYRILRAVMHYYAELPEIDAAAGLAQSAVQALEDTEARYRLVFAHYLAKSISLARAAELLTIPWLELRMRCLRLDVPLRQAPEDVNEAAADVASASEW